MEFIFSKIAVFLNIDLYNTTDDLVLFQRLTVIFTEFLFFYAIMRQHKTFTK